MNIPALYYATSKDGLRPAISSTFVSREDTVATDAHIIVVHKTKVLFGEEFADSLPEKGIMLSDKCIKDIRKKEVAYVQLSSDKKEIILFPELRYIHKYPRIIYKLEEDFEKFPNYKSIIPSITEMKPIDKIKFGSKLLNNLHKAMSPDGGLGSYFIYNFRSSIEGCLVTMPAEEIEYSESYGIIMPSML